MATSTNFKVSNGVTTSTVSNLIGLNITDDNTVSNTDISFASNNLNIKNKSASGSLILGTNNTAAITINSSQNVTLAGNLTVNGTTTTVNSTTVTLDDPILTLGGDTAPATDDNKDRGIEFRWHNGTAAKLGFFGFDDSTGYLTFIPDATNTSEVFSGTMGDIQATNFRGALVGNASTATTLATSRNIAVTGDVTGTASFNGSADASIATTLANSGATAGTYKSLTVNAKGLVTGGTNPTTLSGFGITDAAPIASPSFTGNVTVAGNLLLGGGTLSSWGGSVNALEMGTSTLVNSSSGIYVSKNAYFDSVGWKYKTTALASQYDQLLGGHEFKIAASGTAGTAITWSTPLTIDSTGLASFNNGILMVNATSNLVAFNSNGSGAPTFTTRSAGTKISFLNQLSGVATEQAIGCSDTGSTLWFGVGNTTQAFKWYGGTTLAATLTGTGNLTLVGRLTPTSIVETKVALGANNIDLLTGNYFTKTISGATTLTVTNTSSSGIVSSFILELTNGGSATVTWWSNVKWPGGVAPTLTTAGKDIIAFYTHDNGANWNGLVLAKDVK